MSVPWSGQGLPPAAAGRIASAEGSGSWTSALSTGEFAAVRSAGFEPVGQVMGSAVFHIGRSGRFWGYYDCEFRNARYGFQFGDQGAAPIALSGAGGPTQALVGVFEQARSTALGRMSAECRALGGDGVVAAELTMAPFGGQPNCFEFKVIGTAVRARGTQHVKRPFTSHLDGQGFAKLLSAGWVPVELIVGMSIGVRHDDYRTAAQSYSWGNVEMSGWSKLVHAVRSDAREQLLRQSDVRGADGIVMADSELRVWEEACQRAGNSERTDHVAEATMIGTSIARFRVRKEQPRTLSVMPLGDRGARLRQRLAAAEARPYGDSAQYRRLVEEISELDD